MMLQQWSVVALIILIVCVFFQQTYTTKDAHILSYKDGKEWMNNLSESESLSCPDTWFVFDEGDNGTCVCGNTFYGTVLCDEKTKDIGIQDCYCITLDSSHNSNETVMGLCIFNCVNVSKSYHDFIYHPVPRDLKSGNDNNSICGYLHRKGTLCGECADDHYPAAYSYTYDCIPCHQGQFIPNWLWYVLVAYLPLTVFIIFILVFRVSVVSPQLYGVISILQNATVPLNIRYMLAATQYNYMLRVIYQFLITPITIWNLDFFRTLVPGICLRISSLQVLALDYLIAVYPMAITVTAFVILELHDRGCKPVLFICRPFHRVFAWFRKEWSLRTTLIDAFITFFVLSITKLLYVSMNFLRYVYLYTPNGQAVHTRLYDDASIEFFGSTHYLYGILGIMVILFFIILPIFLLVFYGTNCCQRCLQRTKLKSRVLEDFMYTFNQYYKDGNNGTIDCRWFAAFHIMIRLGGIISLSLLPINCIFYSLSLVFILVCAILVILIEPYSEEYKVYNILEPCLLLTLTGFIAGVTGINVSNMLNREYLVTMFILTAVIGLIPQLYLIILSFQWILKRNIFCHCRRTPSEPQDLPDRLLHSDRYSKPIDSNSTIKYSSLNTIQ